MKRIPILSALLALPLLLVACTSGPNYAEGHSSAPAYTQASNAQNTPMSTPNTPTDTMIATLGNGCFWCTEAVFDQLKGVHKVESGYSGGQVENPTYRAVCSGTTGHAEVLRVWFDPAVISYQEILEVFWNTHDPTTLNRQGADVGTQYRSVIFYHSEEQRKIAEAYKQQLDASGVFNAPIVTAIEPITNYYPAEDYHQEYFANNPNQGYCRAVIRPKVEKFQQQFADKLKAPSGM